MMPKSPSSASRQGGFSLIELLVVVALIAFLTLGLGLALGRGNEGSKLRAAETALAGYLQLLRTQAILDGQPARLLIANDPSNPETYYNYIGGVVADPANPGSWLALDDGFRLSEGVYLWRDQTSVGLMTMQLLYPRRQSISAGTGDPWLYLEINSLGELTQGSGKLLLFADRPQPGALPTANTDSVYGGFRISPLAVVVYPENPSDLLTP